MSKRLTPIDLLRGIVMVMMTVDHASETMNKGRFVTDSVRLWKAGTVIPPAQFLTRWMTHLCAPTFVLLAGVALAISTEKRRARGESEGSIDRHILVRGVLLIVFEAAWMSPVMMEGFGRVLFQVLYAIGFSLVCMAGLRRLSDRVLFGLGIGITVLSEAGIGWLMANDLARTIPAALFLSGGFFFEGKWIIAYPLLPWLAIMCIGWALGRRITTWGERTPRILATCGAGALVVFAIVRGLNGYGNMRVLRDSTEPLQWLHVSKYPPSLTFVCLELGIALLVLAALFEWVEGEAGGPILLFGQVALFYYLLHIHTMHFAAWALGILHGLDLEAAWLGALATLLVLYPVCRFYRGFKAARPNSVLRFI